MTEKNEVVTFAGGVPANFEDLEAGLKNVQSTIQGSTGGVPFLRLLKSGLFVYGADNVEVEEGSEWAINPYSIMHGFACWGEGELLDERMVPFTQEPPLAADLPDLGRPWDQQVALSLQCISGQDTDSTVLYKGCSTGLRNAVRELIGEMLSHLQHDKEHIVPVVTLDSDFYNHKQYGQIFYPVLTIERWMTMEGTAPAAPESDTEADDAEETAAPPRSKNRRRRRAG